MQDERPHRMTGRTRVSRPATPAAAQAELRTDRAGLLHDLSPWRRIRSRGFDTVLTP
jgi:hypothetical protein